MPTPLSSIMARPSPPSFNGLAISGGTFLRLPLVNKNTSVLRRLHDLTYIFAVTYEMLYISSLETFSWKMAQ